MTCQLLQVVAKRSLALSVESSTGTEEQHMHKQAAPHGQATVRAQDQKKLPGKSSTISTCGFAGTYVSGTVNDALLSAAT